ncbi:MAG: hypothetical protein Q9M15_09215 [Mariprofundaceae bacterium]|nr:hypothetical protein [Mariprofundaceae bacterium]
MVAIIKTHNIAKHLDEILGRLDVAAKKMETIIQNEREAAHSFAGEALELLFDDRARCQSELVELESRCRRLMMKEGVPAETSLELFIDEYVETSKAELQVKRLGVLERLEQVRVATDENKILLHAAWSVTNHVLQEIGALPVQKNYGNEVAAYGGMK